MTVVVWRYCMMPGGMAVFRFLWSYHDCLVQSLFDCKHPIVTVAEAEAYQRGWCSC